MKKIVLVGTCIFYLLFFGTIIYGILGIVFFADERQESQREFEFFDDNWVYIDENGNKISIDIPSKVDVPRGKVCRVENILPEIIEEDRYMIFRAARQNMKVYVDGELRTTLDTKETRLFGKYTPTYYVMVELSKEDAGKTIVAEYQTDNRNSGAVGEIYYANSSGFLNYEFHLQGGVLIIGIIMLIISSITLLLSMIMSFVYKKIISLTSISAAILGVSIWILSNSVFRQYVARNVSVISDVSFIVLPLIVSAFAIYVNQIMKERYRNVFYGISGAALFVTIVSVVLHVLSIFDYMESFYATAAVFLILVLAVVALLIKEAVQGYIKEYIVSAVALIIAGACMVVQMMIYLKGGKAFDISIASFGLFIMLILATIDTTKEVYGTYQERDRAKYENQAKSQFLANMSHEIRTPINAILGMNTMVLRKSKDEEILGYADNIDRASQNLLAIVNDILDFSKIEAGKMELVPVSYNLSDVLHDIYNMIHPKAEDKKLEFVVEMDESIPKGFVGDDVRIKQIVINLLTNAVKYTPSGKVTLSITKNDGNEAKLSEKYSSLHFSVKDTGIGIKPEDIDRLTQKFVRFDELRNRSIEGTGLGINIVVSLLEMMNSELKVESVYGEGSVFSFDLVQEITDSNPIGSLKQIINEKKTEREEYTAKLNLKDKRFLVVDDNKMNIKVFKFLVKDYQCQVDEAEAGRKCLELVKENKYDIIFMDHMMPEMDGIETFHQMKEFGDYMNAKTPVVILTANAINGVEEEYLREGFDGYLSKPIIAEKLEEMICRFVSS